jgi:hypothetical protein
LQNYSRYALTVAALGVFGGLSAPAHATVLDGALGRPEATEPVLGNPRNLEAPRPVKINGVKLWIATGNVEQPPDVVREWYQQRYRAHGKAFETIAGWLKKVSRFERSSETLNQLTFGSDEWGGLVLLDPGTTIDSTPELIKRMRKLAETGDLGELGQIRYVQWQRGKGGGTEVFTLTTDSKFPLAKLFSNPGDDDVEGTDVPGVPRPPGGRRILTMEEQGYPLKLRSYSTHGTVEELRGYYEREMARLGWHEDLAYERKVRAHGGGSMRFERNGEEVYVDVGVGPKAAEVRVRIITQQA